MGLLGKSRNAECYHAMARLQGRQSIDCHRLPLDKHVCLVTFKPARSASNDRVLPRAIGQRNAPMPNMGKGRRRKS
jgi:hypothetical protein